MLFFQAEKNVKKSKKMEELYYFHEKGVNFIQCKDYR